jgi:malonyl-CoA decarboxylase
MSPELASLAARNDDVTAEEIAALPAARREEMMTWCARYLSSTVDGVGAVDPVARFHLANGARLERLNWMGDRSPSGMRRSFGMTVNYVYRVSDLERNHDAYANHFRVASSRAFQHLARSRR